MKRKRSIIRIDEDLCTGCGECIIACAEGALALVDGKARLVSEVYCDGLGACLGECPTGALMIEEREAEDFDEAAVEEHLKSMESASCGPAAAEEEASLPCGCPGSRVRVISPRASAEDEGPGLTLRSELCQWPIKLQLLGPRAPFLKDADLLLMADCTAVAFPDLHRKFLRGHAVALGCPKLDDLEAHISRLAEILKGARPRSLTVVHMEVPCCHGFVYAAEKAIRLSGAEIPLRRVQIGINGEIMEEENLGGGQVAEGAGAQGRR